MTEILCKQERVQQTGPMGYSTPLANNSSNCLCANCNNNYLRSNDRFSSWPPLPVVQSQFLLSSADMVL